MTYRDVGARFEAAATDPKVLARAADLIEERGFTKGLLFAGPGHEEGDYETLAEAHAAATCMCAIGAVMLAAFEQRKLRSEDRWNWSMLIRPVTRLAETPNAINWWNNLAETTKEDVVAALRHASTRALEEDGYYVQA